MPKLNFNPKWLMLLGVAGASVGLLVTPEHKTFFLIVLAFGGLFLFLNISMWIRNLMNPPPVPDSAVRLLLKRCAEETDPDEWAIVEFTPQVSLEEARRIVGNDAYTQEHRYKSFMFKFDMAAPSRPGIAIYYSSQKGIAVARVGTVKSLVQKHGTWKLDTWYCLLGAIKKQNMNAFSLDGSHTVPFQ